MTQAPNYSGLTAFVEVAARPLTVGARVEILKGVHTGRRGIVRSRPVTVAIDGVSRPATYSESSVRPAPGAPRA